MDLKHFFDGQQSRENAASAFLATLLEYDNGFRRGFLDLLRANASLDSSDEWSVKIEDTRPWGTSLQDVRIGPGSIDITMESSSTVILIENKLAASAKQDGQLRRYYEAAVQCWPGKRIIALYLGPSINLGVGEVALVRDTPKYKERQTAIGADYVDTLDWGGIEKIIAALPQVDKWFAETGIKAVRETIKDASTGLPHDPQRVAVRRVLEAVKKRLVADGTPAEFQRWPSRGQEDIFTVKGPISLFVTAVFDVDPTSSLLRDVVVENRFCLTVKIDVMLSSKGKKSPDVVAAWNQLLKSGSARVEGLGDLPASGKKRFGHIEAGDYSEEELKELMVARALSVLKFLHPCYQVWMRTGGS